METTKRESLGIAAKGRNELLAHRECRKLTRNQAIRGKCYDCCGGYADGKADCEIPRCPLYPFMPYKTDSNVAATPKTATASNSVDWRVGKNGGEL